MLMNSNNFIDLREILNEEKKSKKCKMPQFCIDLLNLIIPITIIIGTITGICFLITYIH